VSRRRSREVVETLSHQGVIGPERLLPDAKGALVQGSGSGIVTHAVMEDQAQVVEAYSHGGMVGPQRPLPDREGLLEKWPGRSVIPREKEKISEAVQDWGDLRAIGAKGLLPNLQRAGEQGRPRRTLVSQEPGRL
jgi:hypothetical protein